MHLVHYYSDDNFLTSMCSCSLVKSGKLVASNYYFSPNPKLHALPSFTFYVFASVGYLLSLYVQEASEITADVFSSCYVCNVYYLHFTVMIPETGSSFSKSQSGVLSLHFSLASLTPTVSHLYI